MPDDLTRRQLVRRAALVACAPALARGLAGCARRISPNRTLATGAPADGNLSLARATVPELDRPGGAVVLHPQCVPHPVLVANTGSGFVAVQADCPHASCELAWVPEDREAECPCHGSRFAGDGTVLNPPARIDLLAYPVTVDASGAIVLHLFAGDTVFPPVQGGKIVLDATKYPALQQAGGAVLGHPDGLPGPLVITRPGSGPALVALSALCTHLQCTVQPVAGGNLHCPCHGSSFDLRGAVLSQPATLPLLEYGHAGDATGMVTITVPPTCP